MSLEDLHDALLELARDAGFRIRRGSGRVADPDVPLTSGVCRVRGEIWVILAHGDTLADRIDTLAEALRSHAGEFLESRFLAPALRERLEAPPSTAGTPG